MVFLLILISLIFIAFMMVFFNRYRKEKLFWARGLTTKDMSGDSKFVHYFATISSFKLMLYAAALALIVKISLSFIPTSHGDLEIFRTWSIQLAANSPWNYYESALAPRDYAPGYLYVLWALGGVRWLLQLNVHGVFYTFLLKLPAILCDVITAYVLFKIARRYMSERLSILIALIYAINPFVVVNSSIWGQMDGITTLFVFLTIYAMLNKQIITVCIYFAIAVFIKLQALFIAPVVLIYIIVRMKKNVRRERLIFPLSILGCFIGFYLLFLPFTIHQVSDGQPFYLFNVYLNQLASYNEFTLNAFNIYAVLGLNRTPVQITTTSNIIINVLIIAFFSGVSIFFYLKKRDRGCLFLCSAFLILSVFMFSFKMHERYIYPAMLMLLCAAIIYNSKRLYMIYIGYSISQFFNLALILISESKGFPNGESAFMFIGGLVNMILYAYVIYLGIKIIIKKDVIPVEYKRKVNDDGIVNFDESRKIITRNGD